MRRRGRPRTRTTPTKRRPSTTRKSTAKKSRLETHTNLAALGLGSNEGKREGNLRVAVRSLSLHLDHLKVSSPYLTRPLYNVSQRPFLNIALVGHSHLGAEELLGVAKALEWALGRRPGPRFGPRPLDVDLLLIGSLWLRRPELSVPHPDLRNRRFALAPLAEIAPDLEVPPDGEAVCDLLARLTEEQPVEKRPWRSPPLSGVERGP